MIGAHLDTVRIFMAEAGREAALKRAKPESKNGIKMRPQDSGPFQSQKSPWANPLSLWFFVSALRPFV
jgi:hypothetical protein